MDKAMNIITYIICAIAWVLLVWFILSVIEINMHNLDSAVYSDWNMIKLIFEKYL